MPESKAELLTSANEAAGLVQKVFFTYLLVSLYLAILIGSTTHEQLLRESGVQLPLFGVPLSVYWVYAVAPWLYLALHVNLLVQHYLLSRKLYAFNTALERPDKEGRRLSKEEEHEWRVRLYPSIFAQMLAGAERGTFKRFVLSGTVFTTVAVAPVVLLLWMQIQFLPYHSEVVTWGHRLALIVDLALLWYYWPLMMSDGDAAWWRVVVHERPTFQSSFCAVFSLGVLLASTLVAVVPGGLVERMTFETADDWWRADSACDRGEGTKEQIFLKCLRNGDILRSCLARHLNVQEAKLLTEEPPPELLAALMTDDSSTDGNKAPDKTLRERTTGLDLEGRDLRGAILRKAILTKADLSNARLNGACLNGATLTGAILSGAVLHDADLSDAELQEADLGGIVMTGDALKVVPRPDFPLPPAPRSRLIGIDLERVIMRGADLTDAKLEGANLKFAVLENVELPGAQLRGANLHGAELTNVNLRSANLQGVDLRNAKVVGTTTFARADLNYADLRGVEEVEKKRDVRTDAPEASKHPKLVVRGRAQTNTETMRGSSEKLFSDALPSMAMCADGKPSRNVTCFEETATYEKGLIDEILWPVYCQKNLFKPPLSDAEIEALLNALLVRASRTGSDEESLSTFWPPIKKMLLGDQCETDWSDEQREEIMAFGT